MFIELRGNRQTIFHGSEDCFIVSGEAAPKAEAMLSENVF